MSAALDMLGSVDSFGAGARWCDPDLVHIDDLVGPVAVRLFAESFGRDAGVARPERFRIVSGIDPEMAPPDRRHVDGLLEEFARHFGIPFQRAADGCRDGCPAPGAIGSGWFVATTGRPMPEVGGRGGLCVVTQATDVAVALATGRIWWRPPKPQHVRIHGQWPEGVTVHDLAILLRPRVRENAWLVLVGSTFDNSADSTAACALLRDSQATAVTCLREWNGSEDDRIDLNRLRPMVGEAGRAAPRPEIAGLAVDRVYIGSCTTGSVADLRLAARVLAGHRVAVPTVIAPASVRDAELLERETLHPGGPTLAEVFARAGCDLGLPGCASCVNALADAFGNGSKKDDLVCVATSVAGVATRKVARVLTASPITAAEIALSGRV